MTQTDFSTTIKKLLSSFNDNNVKQDAKSKEIISEQDVKFEKELQTLSLQIQEYNKNISSKLDPQDKKISSFTTPYDERHEKMIASNKVRTNTERSKTEL